MFTQFRPDFFFFFSMKQRPEFFSNFGWPDYLFYLQKLPDPDIFFFQYLIMKRNLNSDGQQFHQYQLKEQLPLASNHSTQKNTIMLMEFCLGSAKKCGVLNSLWDPNTHLVDNWIYKNKETDSLLLKMTQHHHKNCFSMSK